MISPADSVFEAYCLLAASHLKASQSWELLSADSSQQKLLSAPQELARELGFSPTLIARIREEHAKPIARKREREKAVEHSIFIVSRSCPEYPAPLLEIPEPPAFLFVRGTLHQSDDPGVAIVGPRASTAYGREVTRRIVEVLAPHVTIISGLAMGIDSVAHEVSIQYGGRTLGVAGCGLDVNYPQGNEKLRAKIPQYGALISAYAPGTSANRQNFPERNAIIAGLAQLTIVIEASEKSGSLITARLAGEFGRDIAAVPGDITRLNSQGSNQLLADGAQIITRPEDALLLLERYLDLIPKAQEEGKAERRAKTKSLPPEQALIYQHLRHEPKSYDALQTMLVPEHLTLGQFTSALLQLEMMGVISQAPGRVFHPKL